MDFDSRLNLPILCYTLAAEKSSYHSKVKTAEEALVFCDWLSERGKYVHAEFEVSDSHVGSMVVGIRDQSA